MIPRKVNQIKKLDFGILTALVTLIPREHNIPSHNLTKQTDGYYLRAGQPEPCAWSLFTGTGAG